jgi:TctA family transporter
VPNRVLAPVLVVLCFLGSYVERNQLTDIVFLILAGLFGFALAGGSTASRWSTGAWTTRCGRAW